LQKPLQAQLSLLIWYLVCYRSFYMFCYQLETPTTCSQPSHQSEMHVPVNTTDGGKDSCGDDGKRQVSTDL